MPELDDRRELLKRGYQLGVTGMMAMDDRHLAERIRLFQKARGIPGLNMLNNEQIEEAISKPRRPPFIPPVRKA